MFEKQKREDIHFAEMIPLDHVYGMEVILRPN